jgi:hypothetical protein
MAPGQLNTRLRCQLKDVTSLNGQKKVKNASKLILKTGTVLTLKILQWVDFGTGTLSNPFSHTELCVNRTDSDVICASEEEMKVEFANVVTGGNLFYSFLYLERQPKMTNYEEPLQNYMVNTYDMMDMKVNKRRISKIKKTYITDDKGWIFPSASEDFVYSLDTFEKDFIMRQEKDSIISYLHVEDTYYRKYTKVQEVIGSIGGFISLIYKLLSMIFREFNIHIKFDNAFKHSLDLKEYEEKRVNKNQWRT